MEDDNNIIGLGGGGGGGHNGAVDHYIGKGSSEVDWCEFNYAVTDKIAEFYNTISNVMFFVYTPILMYLFKPYANVVNKHINLVWVSMMVIGIGSTYFHATLSFLGQILDELSILWTFIIAFCGFCPIRYLPYPFINNRKTFTYTLVTIAIFFTLFSLVAPHFNMYALFFVAVPSTAVLYKELQRCRDLRAFRLGLFCFFCFGSAFIFWCADRGLCQFWVGLNFPYLHSIWHLLISTVVCFVMVLFAFFYAQSEAPEISPLIRLWPIDSIPIGIPYVAINMKLKSYITNGSKNCNKLS